MDSFEDIEQQLLGPGGFSALTINSDDVAGALRDKQKAAVPGMILKSPRSTILLDIKPLEAETDLVQLERLMRGEFMIGLSWGPSKLVPIAYGLQKLRIIACVEDEVVSVDALIEQLEAHDQYVQSVDIVAFTGC
ncbi:unnamed protein product, partial [Mesorhabditis spiculigera]